MLTASARGYAAEAARLLLEKHPDTAGRFGAGAFADWQAHLGQRIEELAAALLAEEPEMFAAEVAWSAEAFRAREVPQSDLRASLECLREVLVDELPESAGELPLTCIDEALGALDAEVSDTEAPDAEAVAPQPVAPADRETERVALGYLEAALEGDHQRAVDAVMGAVEDGLAVVEGFEVLGVAQRRVGEMWHAHEVGVAQEHFVTDTTRFVLTLLRQRAAELSTGGDEPNGKSVVVALAPGNFHDIGTRMVAAHFEMDGWRTVHLAEPMSSDDLVLGLAAFEPDLLALSMSLSTQLSETIDLVERIRARTPGLGILLGGRSLEQRPQLCERIGADAFAGSAADGPRIGRRLVGLSPGE